MPARTQRDAAPTTCILWSSQGQPSPVLTGLLTQRGFRLQTTSDRFNAMAAACAAAAAGAQTVLILDQPDRLRGSADLVEAVRGRLPGIVIWTFDEQRKPQLASFDAAAANRPAASDLPKGSPSPLRLVGDSTSALPPQPEPETGEAGDCGEAGEPDGPARDRHAILSTEELEMLLSDEHDRPRGPTRGPTR